MSYSQKKGVVIELLPFSARVEAADRWRDLERVVDDVSLTQSWNWIQTWLDHYADIVQPTFAFGKLDNRWIGAALITQAAPRTWGIPIPSVYLGTAGEPDDISAYVEYNRLLVAPEYLHSFADALVATLQQQFRWSAFWLNGFVPDHAQALMQQAGLQFNVEEQRCPIFDFHKAEEEGHQDVISALGKQTRYNVRRSLRLFEKEFGPSQIEWAETPEQAKDILRELIDLHQKRWHHIDKPGAFPDERVIRYHEGLIDNLSLWPHGSLILFRLKYGETTLGCLMNFVDQGSHAMSYKSGLPLFDDNRLKPGLVTHTVFMEECHKRRALSREGMQADSITQYNFLVGESPYKDQLSNTEQRLVWATAERGLRLWLIEKARPSLRRAKDLISSKGINSKEQVVEETVGV